MRAEDVVRQFNDCINRGDLDGLSALMTDDHVFVDTEEAAVRGKAACLEAWRGFFQQFPDYRNTFKWLIGRGDAVIAIGFSTCSTPVLDGPAVWMATVRDDAVASWRVYEDTADVRSELRIPQRGTDDERAR